MAKRGPGVEVEGLKEFRSALRDLENAGAWKREFASVQREVARDVASWARSEASGMGGPFAHFASRISGKATGAAARIEVASDANATFWGAKKRTGWNAGNDGRPQHPTWVGNGWDVGEGGGPYAINSTIARRADDIVDLYGDRVEQFAQRAFPS